MAFERFECRSLLAGNAPPVLGGITDFISYSENQVPAIIASTATVQDVDSPNFDTGKLDVLIIGNPDTSDRIGIMNVGTGLAKSAASPVTRSALAEWRSAALLHPDH